MEIFMWSLFPLGIPYSIWRMLKKRSICANCSSSFLVATDSMLGSRILENMENEIAGSKRISPDDFQQFIGKAKQVELPMGSLVPVQPAISENPSAVNSQEQVLEIPASTTVPGHMKLKIDPDQW